MKDKSGWSCFSPSQSTGVILLPVENLQFVKALVFKRHRRRRSDGFWSVSSSPRFVSLSLHEDGCERPAAMATVDLREPGPLHASHLPPLLSVFSSSSPSSPDSSFGGASDLFYKSHKAARLASAPVYV